MLRDDFGDRMKRYEEVTNTKLMNLSPVIVRLDGRAFHSLTKLLDKPYDVIFSEAMGATTWHLARMLQNCVFGYTQSDEISLLLVEPSYTSDSWFDNRIQKIVSIAAAEASTFFREYLEKTYPNLKKITPLKIKGLFDARVFNLPRHEVVNYFIWRQQDCLRNAILGAGQAEFSQKKLTGLSCTQIIEKLKTEKNINFDTDYPKEFIWGKIVYRLPVEMQEQFYTDKTIPADDFKETRGLLSKFLPEYL